MCRVTEQGSLEATSLPSAGGSEQRERQTLQAHGAHQRLEQRPGTADALEPVAGDVADPDLLALRLPGMSPADIMESWLQAQTRQFIREFLSAVPRSEATMTLTLLRPDSSPRVLTRRQLSSIGDLLRPWQR